MYRLLSGPFAGEIVEDGQVAYEMACELIETSGGADNVPSLVDFKNGAGVDDPDSETIIQDWVTSWDDEEVEE